MAKKTPSLKTLSRGKQPTSLNDYLAEVADSEPGPHQSRQVSDILAKAVLEDAFSIRDCARIRGFLAVGVVVQVPSADWVDPIKDALRRMGTFPHIVARTGASRLQDRAEVGNDEVGRYLSANHNVGGVSCSPERYLPSALVAGADIRIEITTPSNRVISDTILEVTKQRPRMLPPMVASGLSFHDLCAAIRIQSTAAGCVRRLTAMTRSRSMADPHLDDVPHVRDLHGYQGAQEWALKLVDDVQSWREGRLAWDQIDRAVVIASDPGLGKTTFARAVAKSLGMPLVPTSVAHWFSSTGGYINEVIKFVDTLLAQAVANGPAVLLLDELDGLPRRSALGSRNRDYWTPIIGHILLALDSAVSGDAGKLVIIGATNHASSLDEALIRPGRLNRVIHLPRPDAGAVAGIMRQHLGDDLAGLDLSGLATLGAGSTGAEIAGWVKAARRTARVAERQLNAGDLMAEIAPPDGRSHAEILATARHEASHAVLSEILHVSEVSHLSIVQSKGMAGCMRARLLCSASPTRAELNSYVVTVLAGRAADEMWAGVSAGSGGHATSDLGIATRTIASCHAALGLGGHLTMRATDEQAIDLVRTDAAFRDVVERDLAELYSEAQRLVVVHASTIDAVAHVLAVSRIIDGATLRRIIGSQPTDSVPCLPSTEGNRHV